MKMYACKRMGRSNTIGNITYFKGIKGFDFEKCGLKCNKAEKEFLLKAKYDTEKEVAELGSKWLNIAEMKELQRKVRNVTDVTNKEIVIQESIIKFIDVCLEKGYEVRLY